MNLSLKTHSSDFLQQSSRDNGLKMNILELNKLISLLDKPIDEIYSQIQKEATIDIRGPRRMSDDRKQPSSISTNSSSNYSSSNNHQLRNSNDAVRVNQDLDRLLSSLSQYRLSGTSSGGGAAVYDQNGSLSGGSEYLYSGEIINSALTDPSSKPASVGPQQCPLKPSEPISVAPVPVVSSQLNSVPNCMFCNEPIFNSSVAALDGYWHQHHFLCHNCECPLENAVYYVDDGKPNCETCHINVYTDKCAYCAEPILETSLSALDQQWHPEHFFCALCQGPFENDVGFHEHQGKPYCSDCYFENFGHRCAGCQNPITDTFLSAMGHKWHNDCFVCKVCRSPFESLNFRELSGEPYCETHYHQALGTMCGACSRPITGGRLVTALGKRFHLDCFQCSYCQRCLAKTSFKESQGRPYCTGCYAKLCPS